jgi:NADPH:quinone reductase-like Zn-dependent oxidoreductase
MTKVSLKFSGSSMKGSQMFAYTYTKYGAPEVLQKTEVAKPTPKPDEVLIKIYATTVSSGDWRARSLTMPKGLGLVGRLVFGVRRPRKSVLGTEFSGVIETVGADVTEYTPGDAVIGFPGASFGAHAEYIVMPANGKLTFKPDHINFEDAAAIPFGGTTAYDFLVNKADIKAGEDVLINGASGATGTACVQIAKHLGANVTAVCSGKNARMVQEIGADRVIDYTMQDFTDEGPQYDAVVDTVATAPFSRTKYSLRPGGRMVMIAGKTSDMIFGGLMAKFQGKRMIGGVAKESPEILKAVVRLAADGVFQPVIDRCYAFDDMRAAHRHVDTGHKKGNVVVAIVPSQVLALAG